MSNLLATFIVIAVTVTTFALVYGGLLWWVSRTRNKERES
jgi:flagellar basal body-associated protein FliL